MDIPTTIASVFTVMVVLGVGYVFFVFWYAKNRKLSDFETKDSFDKFMLSFLAGTGILLLSAVVSGLSLTPEAISEVVSTNFLRVLVIELIVISIIYTIMPKDIFSILVGKRGKKM